MVEARLWILGAAAVLLFGHFLAARARKGGGVTDAWDWNVPYGRYLKRYLDKKSRFVFCVAAGLWGTALAVRVFWILSH